MSFSMKIWKYRKIILSADESIIIFIKRFWWTLMNKHEKTSLRDRTRQNYHSERFLSTANTFIKDAYGHLLCTLTNWTVILLQNLCKNQSCWWHCDDVTLNFLMLFDYWWQQTSNSNINFTNFLKFIRRINNFVLLKWVTLKAFEEWNFWSLKILFDIY